MGLQSRRGLRQVAVPTLPGYVRLGAARKVSHLQKDKYAPEMPGSGRSKCVLGSCPCRPVPGATYSCSCAGGLERLTMASPSTSLINHSHLLSPSNHQFSFLTLRPADLVFSPHLPATTLALWANVIFWISFGSVTFSNSKSIESLFIVLASGERHRSEHVASVCCVARSFILSTSSGGLQMALQPSQSHFPWKLTCKDQRSQIFR